MNRVEEAEELKRELMSLGPTSTLKDLDDWMKKMRVFQEEQMFVNYRDRMDTTILTWLREWFVRGAAVEKNRIFFEGLSDDDLFTMTMETYYEDMDEVIRTEKQLQRILEKDGKQMTG